VELFYKFSDVIVKGEPFMSFSKFCVVSTDNNLFDEENQAQILGTYTEDQMQAKYYEVCDDWEKLKSEVNA